MTPQCAVVASEHDTTCVLFAPSLIEIIARPELYDGKQVRVTGFANLEFEGNSLYVGREDYLQMLFRNGLWLDISDTLARRFSKQLPGYFVVEGEFSSRDHGHLGMWSGAIKNVSRFQPNLSRAEIQARMRVVR